ncbi:MAG TPA: hydantoinase/oxoprolinase family protein, partial [Rhizobiaceae bacterium]|nr:hydantoinase/oxoprolinase family protein [Rhizobiaceae bacterium]
RIPYAWGQEIEGLPVAIPYVDISSIGSGGGSIAYVDNIGVLHVGPEGAGAEPGPAAYGRGGVRPTVTDAYLVCGFIDPDNFIGGGISLDLELARNAIRPLADKLGLSVEDTANGIIRVTTSVQVAEFSRLAAKKGIDYRRYTLVPFGGAGPTHACLLADELRIGKIIIPSTPGTFCALGSVLADFRLDYVKVEYSDLDKIRESEVDRWYGSVAREGRVTLSDVMDSVVELSVQKSVDVRYRGQGFEVSVPFDDLTEIPIRFREEYQKLYGSRQDDAAIEVTSFRATVVGHRTVPTLAVGRGNAPYPMPGSRDVFLTCEHLQVPVYRRADIGQGWSAAGPFIIDQADTTCVVTRGWTAAIDALGCLHLEKAH